MKRLYFYVNSTTYRQSAHGFATYAQWHPYTANDQVLPSFRDEAPHTPPPHHSICTQPHCFSFTQCTLPSQRQNLMGVFRWMPIPLAICLIWAVTHPRFRSES